MDCCRVGFLHRHYIRQATLYDGRLVQVVAMLADSDNHRQRQYSRFNCGACHAVIIDGSPQMIESIATITAARNPRDGESARAVAPYALSDSPECVRRSISLKKVNFSLFVITRRRGMFSLMIFLGGVNKRTRKEQKTWRIVLNWSKEDLCQMNDKQNEVLLSQEIKFGAPYFSLSFVQKTR